MSFFRSGLVIFMLINAALGRCLRTRVFSLANDLRSPCSRAQDLFIEYDGRRKQCGGVPVPYNEVEQRPPSVSFRLASPGSQLYYGQLPPPVVDYLAPHPSYDDYHYKFLILREVNGSPNLDTTLPREAFHLSEFLSNNNMCDSDVAMFEILVSQ